jgi:hypothetical protein
VWETGELLGQKKNSFLSVGSIAAVATAAAFKLQQLITAALAASRSAATAECVQQQHL